MPTCLQICSQCPTDLEDLIMMFEIIHIANNIHTSSKIINIVPETIGPMTDFPQLGKVWILLVSLGHCKLRKPKIFKNNTNVECLGESKDIMLENKFSLFFKKRELCS